VIVNNSSNINKSKKSLKISRLLPS